MGVYARQIATAQKIIKAKGELVKWRKPPVISGGTAAKPGASVPGASYDVYIVFLPIEREYLRTFLSALTGTEVQGGFMQGFMGQVPFEPELHDTVERGSEIYGVLPDNGVEKYDPNGEGAVLYVLRFTR